MPNPSNHRWHKPPGDSLTSASLGVLQQAVNYPKGMHGDSFEEDTILPGLGAGSRMMLLGPQTIPVGVTVTLQPGSVLRIL